MVHAIFKGKIQNLEPGIKAAFVDIGQPKNAFLHYWDIVPQGFDEDIEEIEDLLLTHYLVIINKM